MEIKTCPRCQKPEPREYCWEGLNLKCPFPPRGLTKRDLWDQIRALDERVKHLEPHFYISSGHCFCGEQFANNKEVDRHIHEYGQED